MAGGSSFKACSGVPEVTSGLASSAGQAARSTAGCSKRVRAYRCAAAPFVGARLRREAPGRRLGGGQPGVGGCGGAVANQRPPQGQGAEQAASLHCCTEAESCFLATGRAEAASPATATLLVGRWVARHGNAGGRGVPTPCRMPCIVRGRLQPRAFRLFIWRAMSAQVSCKSTGCFGTCCNRCALCMHPVVDSSSEGRETRLYRLVPRPFAG